MSIKPHLRIFMMALQTLFGIRRQGFFIPYRYCDQLADTGTQQKYSALNNIFLASHERHRDFIKQLNSYENELNFENITSPPGPRWHQTWFPRLDGASAYTIVRKQKPSKIIEIGSGHSTRFMAQAIQDERLKTEFISIDPEPRANISEVKVRTEKITLDKVDMSIFETLKKNDILFIDSSHILMPGTDVDFLFNRIFPIISIGTLIHIHDIFLPYDYPREWSWRNYNEQQAVGTLIQGGNFEIIFSSQYSLINFAKELSQGPINQIHLPKNSYETSLWLKKV
ncbi:MAG: hypothetical protein CMM67_10680 [Rhodospirillaceae bacterium]|nr:hypothetical protein [Rhodospirillaceae bacterium]OUT76536.1 MAG: hypothetical protein CBB83_10860 [Rhodospirillaceae bacterium TMED23]